MVILADTHYIPYFTRADGKVQRAVCGEMIHAVDHTSDPTCPQCKAWIDADAAEAAQFETVEQHAEALFGAADPDARPVFARDPTFEPLAGYRPKGSRR
jgi:hypothetical protein